MSVLYEYFLAETDEQAAAAVEHGRGRAKKSGAAVLPSLLRLELEPTTMLSVIEEFLASRRDRGTLDADAVFSQDGEVTVVRVSTSLQDALILASDEELHEIARPLSETEEFWGTDAAEIGEQLTELASLIRHGIASGRQLYCRVGS